MSILIQTFIVNYFVAFGAQNLSFKLPPLHYLEGFSQLQHSFQEYLYQGGDPARVTDILSHLEEAFKKGDYDLVEGILNASLTKIANETPRPAPNAPAKPLLPPAMDVKLLYQRSKRIEGLIALSSLKKQTAQAIEIPLKQLESALFKGQFKVANQLSEKILEALGEPEK